MPLAPPIADPKPVRLPAAETYCLPAGMAVTLRPYGIAAKVAMVPRLEAVPELSGVAFERINLP